MTCERCWGGQEDLGKEPPPNPASADVATSYATPEPTETLHLLIPNPRPISWAFTGFLAVDPFWTYGEDPLAHKWTMQAEGRHPLSCTWGSRGSIACLALFFLVHYPPPLLCPSKTPRSPSTAPHTYRGLLDLRPQGLPYGSSQRGTHR